MYVARKVRVAVRDAADALARGPYRCRYPSECFFPGAHVKALLPEATPSTGSSPDRTQPMKCSKWHLPSIQSVNMSHCLWIWPIWTAMSVHLSISRRLHRHAHQPTHVSRSCSCKSSRPPTVQPTCLTTGSAQLRSSLCLTLYPLEQNSPFLLSVHTFPGRSNDVVAGDLFRPGRHRDAARLRVTDSRRSYRVQKKLPEDGREWHG